MGKLADKVLEYLNTTPSDQLHQDWEELKYYNTQGPNILDVISNYGRNTYTISIPPMPSDVIIKNVIDNFPNTFDSTDLCLAS